MCVCLDKACDFLEIEGEANKRRYIIHIPHKGEEERIKNTIHPTTIKRWVVERTNSWHNRFRKLLLIRYEKKSTNYLAIVCLDFSSYFMGFGYIFDKDHAI